MAGLKLGEAKGIWVNEYLQTSNPDIYAVGDAIEFSNPITNQSMNTLLAGPANKQGRICANNIVRGNKESYNGSINTAIVKVFDMIVATAGTASKHLTRANIPHIVSTNHGGSHAGYYPGSKQMTIQLAFSPTDGTLYSAQIAGYEGVDKRIDVLSYIIKQKGTIYDLAEFEHAYAPPKDPINMAGFIGENILMNNMKPFYWNDINGLNGNSILIDVRSDKEFSKGHIPGAVNIPVDDIRNRLSDFPTDKKIYTYCAVGLRGYLAQRILRQRGFEDVYNLSGGYKTWEACNNEAAELN
jgi:rhodanese-related sulfurtransferase